MLLMVSTVFRADHGCTFTDYQFQSCTGLAGFAAPISNVMDFLVTSLHLGISPFLATIAAVSEWKSGRHAPSL